MKETIEKNWDNILKKINTEHDISDVAINTFIRPLKLYDIVDNKLIFLIDKDLGERGITFIKTKCYDFYLQLVIEEITNQKFTIEIIEEKDTKDIVKAEPAIAPEQNTTLSVNNLNPKYTFSTFVVGKNNKLAHAACVAVAESPAEAYNPLFLYGGVGLGKTHLMHSIAHYILEHNKDAKVLYVTSEKFTNELIDAIRHDKNEEFRDKYRHIDVLLIDDIQFIIGKESTQEEFFHTFNALYEAKKQIIISSDKPPKDMETLEERLRSRFEWGLPADIQAPDYETRMAILRKKAELDNLDISDSVLEYVASNIKSNIRELEGALNKICVFSDLERKPINVELAEEAIKDLITPETKKEITPELIIAVVAEHFNITATDMISSRKSKEIAYPRQIAMYLCKKLTEKSLKYVGNYLGKRDHTTVLHGAKKIEAELQHNETLANTIDVIIKKINPN
ncbi:MAG: chromosomal replication initiator protein DnaA [Lachnospiraceae bacterium]|nr:chromosomal replication initiator protein DnaA [Lachnospiraceae bacterium]